MLFVLQPKPQPPAHLSIEGGHILMYLGDDVAMHHLSPAGSMSRTSPASRYLSQLGYVGLLHASLFLVTDGTYKAAPCPCLRRNLCVPWWLGFDFTSQTFQAVHAQEMHRSRRVTRLRALSFLHPAEFHVWGNSNQNVVFLHWCHKKKKKYVMCRVLLPQRWISVPSFVCYAFLCRTAHHMTILRGTLGVLC